MIIFIWMIGTRDVRSAPPRWKMGCPAPQKLTKLRRLTLYSTEFAHISKRRAERFHFEFCTARASLMKNTTSGVSIQSWRWVILIEYLSATTSTDFLPLCRCRANHRPGHDKVLAATVRAGESPLEIPHQHLTSLPHLASGRFLLSGRKCCFPSHATPRFQLLWQRRSCAAIYS